MGTHTAIIDVLLYVPMMEAATRNHTVTIGITADGEDINPEDNQDSVDMITGSIHFPELNGSVMDMHALTGSSTANQRFCNQCWQCPSNRVWMSVSLYRPHLNI